MEMPRPGAAKQGGNTLKRIALLAVIGAGLLALPGTAAARSDCFSGGPVEVYGTAIGSHGGADSALVGACVDTNLPADGGYAEVGSGYGIVDGSDVNPGNGAGYAGLNAGGVSDSNKDANCDGDDTGGDHNSGGCLWIKPAPPAVNALLQNAVTAMFICGNTSGADWAAAGRDGCSIP
jgi:hypothetical protein